MAESFLLLNDGVSFLLLNDGTSKLLLNEEVVVEAGASGGRVRKKTGRQLEQGDLGPKPSIVSSGESLSKIVTRFIGLSHSKLDVRIQNKSEGVTIPYQTGFSNSQISIPTKNESYSKLLYKINAESWGVTHPSIVMERINTNQIRIAKINHYSNILKEIDNMEATKPVMLSFEFNEQTDDPTLRAFTGSSSFVGNVRYNRETQGMRILLNGIPYNFCNVPERIFDAFEGADSKGAFFNRNIKTQFDC